MEEVGERLVVGGCVFSFISLTDHDTVDSHMFPYRQNLSLLSHIAQFSIFLSGKVEKKTNSQTNTFPLKLLVCFAPTHSHAQPRAFIVLTAAIYCTARKQLCSGHLMIHRCTNSSGERLGRYKVTTRGRLAIVCTWPPDVTRLPVERSVSRQC